MANLFGGFLKKIEKPQSVHPPSVSQGFSQYEDEYITYCIEQEKTISELEAGLHTSDDPEVIAKQALVAACAFYGADWSGIIELDLELNIWASGWWHNADPNVKELEKLQEFENLMIMPSIVDAIKKQKPIIIYDVEDIARSSPKEYQVYKRLDVRSLIAVPFGPNPMGFLAVRNPQKYNNRTSTLNILAYVLHRAIAQKNTMERVRMALTPDEIKTDNDVIINFFGGMEITTSAGVWKDQDFNSPKSSRAVAYIMLNRKTAHSALAIADALYPEDGSDIDIINKNIRGYIYRFRKSFEPICKNKLIEYTSNGYRLNPSANVMSDLQKFEKLWKQVQKDIPIPQKVHSLKHAIKLYKGHVLGAACDDHWIVGIATDYKMKYIAMVNELLSILADFEDYDGIHHFATQALKLVPENVRAQYWLVYAIYHSSAVVLAKREIEIAKNRLTSEEFDTLQKFICKDESLPYGQLFD
ncbi:MAG: hypothetical protein IJB59_08745 [Oscillospiraceae bacterium]|nr:hypothetical protein [Oscillospiraceae bacterium]